MHRPGILILALATAHASVAAAAQAPDTTRPDSAQLERARRDSIARRDAAMRDTAARGDSAVADRIAVTRRGAASAPPARSRAAAAPEPAGPAIPVALAPGRSARDSIELVRAIRAGMRHAGWPVATPAPLPGSVLPTNRIVAFYGTPLSRRMGILGQLPPDSMLARLDQVAAEWRAADPATPVQPALHFIAVVAQEGPGRDGKYRLRMDSAMIEQVYGLARRADALLFLDIQPGHSSVADELPRLARFLERPDVHLGIDPEFNMRHLPALAAPGTQVGSLAAADINGAVRTLAEIVARHALPPKVLVIHRFRAAMVRNARDVTLDPRVQIVMHMDGWGIPAAKFNSYRAYIVSEPVQFTGFKLFFRHDTRLGDRLLTPAEILQLRPAPLYIQYQ